MVRGLSRYPVWLWPNLLSLDAPMVAIAWQTLFARCFQVTVPWADTILLGISVWLIYVADRTLDAWNPRAGATLAPRHFFYQLHFSSILPWCLLALAVAVWVSCTRLDRATFDAGLCMGAAMLAYFALVHCAPRPWQRYWPKELVVAVLFALGICVPVWAEMQFRRPGLLAPMCLFTSLVWINTVGIESWERGRPLTCWLRRHFTPFAVLVSSASLCMGVATRATGPIYLAGALGGFSLAALERKSVSLSTDALRVLADAVLLAPVVILLLLSSR